MAFDEAALVSALERAQVLGFIGRRPVAAAIEHSRQVVAALEGTIGTVVDLGAGGGLPGLVIACDRPDLVLTLIDRRAKRTDFLELIVRRGDLGDRVTVECADVDDVATSIAAGRRPPFDAAVARGLGPPESTIVRLAQMTRVGGRMVVTEPPSGDRWEPGVLRRVRARRLDGPPSVAVFQHAADLG